MSDISHSTEQAITVKLYNGMPMTTQYMGIRVRINELPRSLGVPNLTYRSRY